MIAITIIFCLGFGTPTFAQLERRYKPREGEVSLSYRGETYTIVYEPKYSHFTTEIRPKGKSEFSFYDFDWHRFFNQLLGMEAEQLETKEYIFYQITSQLLDIVENENLSTTELVSLVYAFVNQLGVNPRPREYENAMLLPVDLLHLGPKTRQDYLILNAVLLSSLCVDIQMVGYGEKWQLAVLANENLEGQKYRIDDFTYVFVDGVARSGSEQSIGNGLASTIEINERCIGVDKHYSPINSYPNVLARAFTEKVEEVGKGTKERLSRSRGGGWEVNLAPAVSALHKARSDRNVGHLFDPNAGRRLGRSRTQERTNNHLLLFGRRGDGFGTVKTERMPHRRQQ